ncbi:hypothetical protein [Candidatus Cardinium hertigii]|uniref:DUF3575 domain-containing protein n=1 Tax=Candidatus Cardinium hertigii TaxID=247481 RepID=A0A3N2QAW6_9BACT|nr:hypothetical protein [Candidatus Cardinium hertigii]ROT46946.1 hypothetical protein EDM02_05205 [Candidatus Cardinium hertigii]
MRKFIKIYGLVILCAFYTGHATAKGIATDVSKIDKSTNQYNNPIFGLVVEGGQGWRHTKHKSDAHVYGSVRGYIGKLIPICSSYYLNLIIGTGFERIYTGGWMVCLPIGYAMYFGQPKQSWFYSVTLKPGWDISAASRFCSCGLHIGYKRLSFGYYMGGSIYGFHMFDVAIDLF